MVKRLELSYTEFKALEAHCRKIGIQFLSTPDEEESLDFLVDELNLPWIKVGSGEVNNLPFLRRVASKKRPVIMSTGMSTLGEVEAALTVLQREGAPEVVLLHCTTNYPCPLDEVNLRAMQTLREAFKVRTGYSDHTLGLVVPIAAVAMGAEIIEKHFTLDPTMEGPDHKASLDPDQLKEMVDAIRGVEAALGDGIKRPNASEDRMKPLIRRGIVGCRAVLAGSLLREEDLCLKRVTDALSPELLSLVLGRRMLKPLEADAPLTWNHLLP
jgi:sialic acid synthase SpsE